MGVSVGGAYKRKRHYCEYDLEYEAEPFKLRNRIRNYFWGLKQLFNKSKLEKEVEK